MVTFSTPSDDQVDICAELYLKCFASPPWYEDNDFDQVRDYIKSFMIGQDRNFYTLYLDGTVIAMAFCSIVPSVGNPFMRIEDYCIDPHYIRLGLSSRFMEYLISEAKSRNCNCILCATVRDSAPQSFYEKNGFRELENSIYMYREI